MSFQIAEAYVDITARNLMADALASAVSQIRGVGAEADAVGAKSAATGILGSKAFLAIGAAAAGGAVEVVKMAGDFQASTERLVTSAGESQKNIGLVRDGILAMAGSVGYSAEQLSAAMYKIESGGQHGADGLRVLQAAAEGAKTENADLTTVADAVTSAMQDYHLKASDAAMVTSKLVAATASGKMTFEELAGSMSAILPIASANHVSLNDILGDLASMTVHGESAQQAAQNLTVGGPHIQRQRDDVIDHHMRRQVALADTGALGLLQNLRDFLGGEKLGDHAEANVVSDPAAGRQLRQGACHGVLLNDRTWPVSPHASELRRDQRSDGRENVREPPG